MRSPREVGNPRDTVRSSLFGPLVNRSSAWFSAFEALVSTITCPGTSREFHLDSSDVFIVCVVLGRNVIVVYA